MPPLYNKKILLNLAEPWLIPMYESHIRVTKETIQFVVNLTKEIPYSNSVTKERTPKKPYVILTRISPGDHENIYFISIYMLLPPLWSHQTVFPSEASSSLHCWGAKPRLEPGKMNVGLMLAEKVTNRTFTDFKLWISNNFRKSCPEVPGG